LNTKHFDIIIAGAGAAGMSLLYRALKSDIWHDKNIAIIDQHIKPHQEKTWCFWQKEEGPFESILFKKWKHYSLYSNAGQHLELDTHGYDYKMLRSIDFFHHVNEFIKDKTNVSFINDEIKSIQLTAENTTIIGSNTNYTANYIFNSAFQFDKQKKEDVTLLQHFKGYFIKTSTPTFDETRIHFMDFRVAQIEGSAFVYVLPLSKHEALIEYTVFSEQTLSPIEYDIRLKSYIHEVLGIKTYDIIKEEFGVIPMTTMHFSRRIQNIINIGTIGGDTRASTGYTFNNLQKTIQQIIIHWKKTGNPYFHNESTSYKHQIFDKTILKVLAKDRQIGHQIFTQLFKKNRADRILRFLDGDSSFVEDLLVMNSVPRLKFIRPFVGSLTE
jgi:lycopene beta-cyclase